MCDFSYDYLAKLFKRQVSFPPQKKVSIFVLDLCFCLFCMFVGGGGMRHPTTLKFYCTLVRKYKHHLLDFYFLKTSDFLCGTKHAFYEYSMSWENIYSLRKSMYVQELQLVFIKNLMRNGKPLNTINGVIFSPQNYTKLYFCNASDLFFSL